MQKAIEYREFLDKSDKAKVEDEDEDTKKQYVFLYELAKQTRDRTELTDQLMSILLAGRDTTAGLLSLTFHVLARRPDIWTKLREHVLALQGRKPSFEDLKSISYLNWVLNESEFFVLSLLLPDEANKQRYGCTLLSR